MRGLSLEALSIVLRPGDQHRLYLGGLGSAGYAWETEITGQAGIVQLALEPLALPSLPSPGGPPPATFSVEFILVITAQAPGAVEVRACLRRPWEKDKPPLRELRLEISVLA
jgi:predicted secreted protein